jgi:hypothetical protein
MQDPLADSSDRSAFLKILNQTSNPASSSDVSDNLKRLRRLVLTRGIPNDTDAGEDDNGGQIRARVWKLLLRIDRVSPDDYLRCVDMGPSEVSAKSEYSCLQFEIVANRSILDSQERYIPNLSDRSQLQGQSPRGHAYPLARGIRLEEQPEWNETSA